MLNKQNHASVILELKKMHPNFEVNQEQESLQTSDNPKQKDPSQIAESPCEIYDLDVLASLQKMKADEQAGLERKQNLLALEQDLHTKLVREIDKKKTRINNLKSEILGLENRCKALEQALGIPVMGTEECAHST